MAAILPLMLLPPTPAVAQCDTRFLAAVKNTATEEGDKSEKFRTGNKAAFKKIFDARAASGRRDKAADEKLAAELTRRMSEVHDGLPKQVAAMETFRKDFTAAMERQDCVIAQKASQVWMAQARARIAEYDRYFGYLDSLLKEAEQPQSR